MEHAASHALLAQVALAAGDAAFADAGFQKAGGVLASSGQDTRAIKIGLELERASMEVRQGRLDRAAGRLESVKKGQPAVYDQSETTLYRETLGELYLRSGKPRLAEKELLEAVRLIEMDKNSLSSETDFLAWQLSTAQTYRLLLEIYSTRSAADARSLAFLEWHQAEPLRIDARNARKLTVHPLGRRVFPDASEAEYIHGLAALSASAPTIVWAAFPSELVIWELDQGGVHRVRVSVAGDLLKATATRFSRLCADPNSDLDALRRDARQLYAWLIQPIADRLPASGALVVEPDVSLHLLPFQALQEPDGRYLGERFAVSESAGLLYSRVLRPDKAISHRTVAVAVGDPLLGVPQRGEYYRRLPDADREAHVVAAHFDTHEILTGRQATLSGVVNLLPRAEVFHFAGHFLAHGREPGLLLASETGDPGEIVLLGQRHLRPNDLRRLQLAVLSGCVTAVADQGMTDPGSLIRIFLRSGVPHVVASKWRVDSQVSAEIMGHLYTRLLQGDSVTAALADSERTIRSNPATAHPYYWGPLRPLAAEGPEEGAWREERWAETPPPAWTSQCRH